MFSLSDRGKVVGGLPDVVTIMEKKVCLSLLCSSYYVVNKIDHNAKINLIPIWLFFEENHVEKIDMYIYIYLCIKHYV